MNLTAYLKGPRAPKGDLLFPAVRGVDTPMPGPGEETMIQDLRKTLDRMPMPERLRRSRTKAEIQRIEEERAKKIARWEKGGPGPKPNQTLEELRAPIEPTMIPPLRTKMLRHSWAAARLQTLDRGEPIDTFRVARELGHKDVKMIEETYGHVAATGERKEYVEFRW